MDFFLFYMVCVITGKRVLRGISEKRMEEKEPFLRYKYKYIFLRIPFVYARDVFLSTRGMIIFIHSFMYLFIYSFTHLFIYSFTG